MNLLKLLLISSLLLGCSGIKNPNRTASNALAPTVQEARMGVNDRAAGNNAAIEFVTNTLDESKEKEAIGIFVEDNYRILGKPSAKTEASFLEVAKQLLSDSEATRVRGQRASTVLSSETQDLLLRLERAEKKFEEARITEESNHAAEIEKLKIEAQNKEKRFISYLFFGGAFLFVIGGVATLVLQAQVPMLGPRVAFGLFAGAVVSALTGVLVLQLLKQMDEHPWILWTGVGLIGIILTAVGSLLYANHHHAKE